MSSNWCVIFLVSEASFEDSYRMMQAISYQHLIIFMNTPMKNWGTDRHSIFHFKAFGMINLHFVYKNFSEIYSRGRITVNVWHFVRNSLHQTLWGFFWISCQQLLLLNSLKDRFCTLFFHPRTRSRTSLQCFALDSRCSEAKHCRNVLGRVLGRKYKIQNP